MKKEHQETPRAPVPLWLRALFPFVAFGMALEALTYAAAMGHLDGPLGARVLRASAPVLLPYLRFRAWVVEHQALTVALGVVSLVAVLFLVRAALLVWHNHVVARLSGTYFRMDDRGFPMATVDLLKEIARRPKGQTFVGLSPARGFWGWHWKRVFLSTEQRTMHRHVLGKTGSGKTKSILWPQVLQDSLDAKAVVVMDAKGSDENVRMVKAIAARAGRQDALRVFCLPAWNRPQLFSHTYNVVWVRPRGERGRLDPGGDPVAAAERVFSAMKMESLGDNAFYNTQAELMFTHVVRLLHGMEDEHRRGLPFSMRDIAVVLKGMGATDGCAEALNYCRESSKDQDARREIDSLMSRLGADLSKCMSGLIGAVDKLQSPLVNAYAPDLIFEEVLERNLLVYIQLPANLFKIQAPAIGRAMLMDLQQEGSLRQVFRQERAQGYVSVSVDEFYNFADISVVDSLNKLRDAKFQFTLLHQSLADLELVSKEFAKAVWDNTRTRDVLSQDNPQLCEELAKSIGTHQVVEMTVRRQAGALFTSLQTGDASSKLVESYRVHPNRIKNLAQAGQGYLVTTGRDPEPICYGMMPELSADYALPRNDQSRARGLYLYERYVRDWTPKPAKVPPVPPVQPKSSTDGPPPA